MGGGHSDMKVTGMCITENENRGHSVQDFVEKKAGVIKCGIKKWAFLGVNFPKQADRNSFERPLINVLCMRGPGWF